MTNATNIQTESAPTLRDLIDEVEASTAEFDFLVTVSEAGTVSERIAARAALPAAIRRALLAETNLGEAVEAAAELRWAGIAGGDVHPDFAG